MENTENEAESTGPAKRHRRWPWITGGAVAAVVVAAGVIGAFNRDKPAGDSASPPPAAVSTQPEPASSPAASSPAKPSTPASSAAQPPANTQPAPPADPVNKLRAAFRADYSGKPWFGKLTAVDLDGRGVIGRSTLTDGDSGALAACEALRSSATKATVDFQSVAIRDARDRTVSHWSGLTGDPACTS